MVQYQAYQAQRARFHGHVFNPLPAEWVAKALQYVGITSRKKTHAGRSSGAKTVELKGVNESQIRRAGHWNQEQMVGCYLDSLPCKFMRIMAGHPAEIGAMRSDVAVLRRQTACCP